MFLILFLSIYEISDKNIFKIIPKHILLFSYSTFTNVFRYCLKTFDLSGIPTLNGV